jgi:hypothetical protein
MTAMIRWLQNLLARLLAGSGPRAKGTDRSTLTQMYLHGANQPGSSTRELGTRERENGKFSQRRSRG